LKIEDGSLKIEGRKQKTEKENREIKIFSQNLFFNFFFLFSPFYFLSSF